MNMEFWLLIAAVFVAAGMVKGIVGLGLPTVAMGALALAMPPSEAAALLVLPSLVTNIWQLLVGPDLKLVLRRLATMMLFVCLGTSLGIGFLTQGTTTWPSLVLGVVLAVYGMIGLFAPRFQVPLRYEPWLGPMIGATTGVLTGATGVFVVPAVPYLSALGFNKEELIQALGLSFTISTLALAIGLAATGNYSQGLAVASVIAVLPALAGMYVGQAVRDRLDAPTFRRWFFRAMVLVGLYMAIRTATT